MLRSHVHWVSSSQSLSLISNEIKTAKSSPPAPREAGFSCASHRLNAFLRDSHFLIMQYLTLGIR
jgi:hypothetical protein